MVAKVNTGKTIRGALNYNENKVAEGMATCILASKFGDEPGKLSFHDKLYKFLGLIEWNKKVKTNTVHISLNFDVSEKLPVDRLQEISASYMSKIGFGDQPYLVYQHLDAAHPHIHILTTNIQSDASRIDLHNIGRNQSEKARKEIETEFKLVRAESRKKRNTKEIHAIDMQAALYGKSETKRSISNTVKFVGKSYRYTSLPEFNAALRQFNVVADRGTEDMTMFSKMGLRYYLLDAKGNKVGVPIKASSIHDKPTHKYLEKQFKLNDHLRRTHKETLKQKIESCFSGQNPITSKKFNEALASKGVYVLMRFTPAGGVYGITFVDNATKCVFNGSDLGKGYSAKAITERISDVKYPKSVRQKNKRISDREMPLEVKFGFGEVIKDITTAMPSDFTSPEAALRVKRKRRKRGRRI
jgi:hypothetical protein